MKIKLFILFSLLIAVLGYAIFHFGFRKLDPKHKPKGNNEDNREKVFFIN